MKRLVLKNKASVLSQIQSYLESNSEAKFIHRLQVMLLFAVKENESCDSVGALFGNSPRSISNWVKKLNRTGDIESLRSKPQPGRPARLTKEQKKDIKAILVQLPKEHGLSDNRWNGRNLSSYIRLHYGISLKVRSCQRLMQELSLTVDVLSGHVGVRQSE
jgi:transposase